tara:strand:+ start:291264 stop:291896 length:633 start_codon:yes stop_codon:yes gene_type:complete
MMKKICFVILLFIFCSCQPALRVIFGVKTPKIENQKTLENFIDKKGLEIDLNKTYFLKELNNYYSLQEVRDRGLKVPDVYLFNEAGYLIQEQLDSVCFIARDLSVDEYKNYYEKVFSTDTIKPEKLYHIDDLIKHLADGEGNRLEKIQTNNKKTAIILWAKFLGKRQNNKFVEKTKELLLETQLDLNIYYLNLDPQDFWEESNSISTSSE